MTLRQKDKDIMCYMVKLIGEKIKTNAMLTIGSLTLVGVGILVVVKLALWLSNTPST